ncbi:MAG: hypothetical protein ACP5NX_00010 [Candidatus Bilamarchaeaceae archaeon]
MADTASKKPFLPEVSGLFSKKEQKKEAEKKSEAKPTAPSKAPEPSKNAASPQIPMPPPLDPETEAKIKEVEKAFFALQFYPVATKREDKDKALETIRRHYKEGNDTLRQLILYFMQEYFSRINEFKIIHNFEFMKQRLQGADPGKIRFGVYRAMFDYNSSLEGMLELYRLLAQLGGDDSAKLLTYHFTFLCSVEGESVRMLRNGVIEALGDSDSYYALKCLLDYAKNCDQEHMLVRMVSSISKWQEKAHKLDIPKKEKEDLLKEMEHVLSIEISGAHYG